MSDEKDPKKIMVIRTFAGDVDNVRKKQKQINTEISDIKTPTEKKAGDKTKPKDYVEPKKDSKTTLSEPKIPPFHFIRASSPDETTYDDNHAIPDKKTLKKETLQKFKIKPLVKTDKDDVSKNKNSLLTKENTFHIEENNETNSGSIITDHKRKQFKLFPAIFDALKNKFSSVSAKPKKVRVSEQAVTESNDDIELIKLTTKKATPLPVTNHKETSKNTQQKKHGEIYGTLKIHDKVNKPTPTRQTEKREEVKKEKPLITLQKNIEPVEKQEVTKETDSKKLKNEIKKPQQKQIDSVNKEKEVPKETDSEINIKPEPRDVDQTIESVGYTNYRKNFGEDFNPKEELLSKKTKSNENRVPINTNVPSLTQKNNILVSPIVKRKGILYSIFITFLVLSILLGIGTSVWWFTNEKSFTTETTNPENQTFTNFQTTDNILLNKNKDIFFNSIQKIVKSNNGGLTEIKIMNENISATTADILTTLQFNAPGSFMRAITDITFGTYNNNPFIILNFNSFDIVFGGILTWEKNMTSDLEPLFGESVKTTILDKQVDNHDVRVLIGNDEVDKITYGFIDKNTILITTDRQTYTNLFTQIK